MDSPPPPGLTDFKKPGLNRVNYILTSAQSFGSQDYYSKSLMTILGLADVLFYTNKQT